MAESNHVGIRVSSNCEVSGNYCKGNFTYGILAAGAGNVIKENMVCLNGDCVRAVAGNAVINNQACDNDVSAFSLSGSTESGNISF